MKAPNNTNDQPDNSQDKEEKQINKQFLDKDGRKYEKVYNGHMGVYVWEVTYSSEEK